MSTWDLSFMYNGHDDPQIMQDVAKANEIADDLIKHYKGRIASGELSSQEILKIYQQLELLTDYIERASGYSFLLFSEQTGNDNYKILYGKLQQEAVTIQQKLVFLKLELNLIPDEIIEKYLADPILANYHHDIKMVRAMKPYLLSEEVEQVIMEKSLVGVNAWYNFYEELTSTFEFEVEIEGKVKKLSHGEIYPLFRHPDPQVRESAYRAYYKKYAENKIPLTYCFNNVWKDHGQNTRLRKYPSTMTPAFLETEVDEPVIETMMNNVAKNYTLVQEYYKAKAKLMGLDKIKGSDLYAPIGKAEKTKFSWEEAMKEVLESYSQFDPEFGQLASSMFEKKRVDSEVRKGKMTGAFCAGISPKLDPVILMTFDGTDNSVSTLAHEMGHALHDLFAGRAQTPINYHPPRVAAETASIFGEYLLLDRMLNKTTSPEAKLALLAKTIEDAFATISRQTMYVFWEKECHEKGAIRELTAQEMCDLWDKRVKEMYGDAVEFLPEQSWNWSAIPHFLMTRFYCFSYSYGNLFVVGLYQQYLKEGKSFIPKYKKLLSAGGSKSPIELAKEVGIDVTQEDFWQDGFNYIKRLIDEFTKIVERFNQ